MSVTNLPTTPWATTAEVIPLNYGVRPPGSPTGGVRRRYSRMGSRHALHVVLPDIAHGLDADAWIAALLEAEASSDPVRFVMPQNDPRGYISITGALVNGGSQAGRSLAIDTVTLASGTIIPKGRALSLIVSGRSYLYYNTADATVSGGAATLTLDCMLRASPADNTAVTCNSPVIEGHVIGDPRSWTIQNATIKGLDFRIEEIA